MKKYSTKALIEHIEESNYTDVIFDCDETVMHLIIDWSWSDNELGKIAQKLGLETELVEMGGNVFMEHILMSKGLEYRKELNDMLLIAEQKYHKEIIPNSPLIDFIKSHSKKYTFHMISNNMSSTISKGLKQFGLEKHFHEVISRDRVTYAKPNPEGINTVHLISGTPKEKILMVGDSVSSDGGAAERAGVDYFCIDMYL